jgi:hypothetical protein
MAEKTKDGMLGKAIEASAGILGGALGGPAGALVGQAIGGVLGGAVSTVEPNEDRAITKVPGTDRCSEAMSHSDIKSWRKP